MQLLLRLSIFLLFTSPSFKSAAQLTITSAPNAQALAQKLVGEGVQISNVTFTGQLSATGFFKSVNTGVRIDSGIVLTNGSATGVAGASGGATASTSIGVAGDDDLSALVNQVTSDASILEFDFVPLGDSIRFKYVFSSEEYPNYACSPFNDVFAFFLSGPGIIGKVNLALVPGTNIPVSINSINGAPVGTNNPIAACNAMGPGSPFGQYYISNSPPTPSLYVRHNGNTVVLIATAAVTACLTYHLKIAISDAGSNNGGPDRVFDSGVFLEAGSLTSNALFFTNNNPVLGGNIPYLAEGCHAGGITISRPTALASAQVANLTYAGTATNGIDVATLPASLTIPAGATSVALSIVPLVDNLTEGDETLKIYLSAGGSCGSNLFTDSITIQLRDVDTLSIMPRVVFCAGSTVQLQTSTSYLTYQWSPAATLSNATISNPVATPTDGILYLCTATLFDCIARDSIRLFAKKLELIERRNIACLGASTGQISVSGGGEWVPPVRYRLNGGAFGTDSLFTGLSAGNYKVFIRDATGCIDSLSVDIGQAYAPLGFTEMITPPSCVGTTGTITIAGVGGLPPYQFALNGTSFSPVASFSVIPGSYSLAVRDAAGCTSGRTLIVADAVPLLLSPAPLVTPAGCVSNGTLTAFASGGVGPYQFAANGGAFDTSNRLSVPPGPTTLSVKDAGGCQRDTILIVPTLNTLQVDAGTAQTICEGDVQTLTATAPGASFVWTGGSVSNPAISNPTTAPDITTTYFVTATLGRCTAIDSVTVSVWPAPAVNAGPDSSICVGKSIMLSGSGGMEYSWSPVTAVSNAFISNPSIQPLRETFYSLLVRDANGCWSLKSDSVRISVVPAVKVFAGRDTAVADGQTLQLQGRELSNAGATVVAWSPVRGLNNPGLLNPVAVLDRDISYELLITTPEGCQGRDSIIVKVYKRADIYVPTAFTPNADGKNDRLQPLPIGMKQLTSFRLFNRWGNLVFFTTTGAGSWDGTINGKPAPAESFVWVAEGIDYKGAVLVRKGVVTLIR